MGLVGGLGVGAAIHYYRELARLHSERGSTMHLVMLHADVEQVLRLASVAGADRLADYLSAVIGRLAAAGADIAAIPAVTPHICEPRLREISPLPLVSLVAEMVDEVRRRKLKRVALFGTRLVVETALFGRLAGVQAILPRPDEVEAIHKAYLDVVRAGAATSQVRETLRGIAHRLCDEEGVESILLAGTELALVFEPENTDFPCLDGARIHLDALMRHLFPVQS